MLDSKTPETRRAFPATTGTARAEYTPSFAAFAFCPIDRGGLKWKSAILLTNWCVTVFSPLRNVGIAGLQAGPWNQNQSGASFVGQVPRT